MIHVNKELETLRRYAQQQAESTEQDGRHAALDDQECDELFGKAEAYRDIVTQIDVVAAGGTLSE